MVIWWRRSKVGTRAESADEWLARWEYVSSLPRMKVIRGGSGGKRHVKSFSDIFWAPGMEMEGWQQFVVHARDRRGDGVSDYMTKCSPRTAGAVRRVHRRACRAGLSFRCHVRLQRDVGGR